MQVFVDVTSFLRQKRQSVDFEKSKKISENPKKHSKKNRIFGILKIFQKIWKFSEIDLPDFTSCGALCPVIDSSQCERPSATFSNQLQCGQTCATLQPQPRCSLALIHSAHRRDLVHARAGGAANQTFNSHHYHASLLNSSIKPSTLTFWARDPSRFEGNIVLPSLQLHAGSLSACRGGAPNACRLRRRRSPA